MANLKRFAAVGGVFAVMIAALGGFPATAGYAGSLEVKFDSLKNKNGQVCLTLFGGPKGFPAGGKGSNLKSSRCVAVEKGASNVTFTNLPYGNYAIAAIHDINSDGQLNKNAFGLPSEGFGFSNNPPLRYGPASFADSQFFLSGTKTVVQIQMRYL
jgi:uncharacterized protein (DUF2141 family)